MRIPYFKKLKLEQVGKNILRKMNIIGLSGHVNGIKLKITTTTTTTLTLFLQFLKGLCSPQLAQLFWAGYLN